MAQISGASVTGSAVFAIPGDIDTLTGGYIYEKRLLLALRQAGWTVEHLALPGSYPEPTEQDLATTIAALAALPADMPVLLDGFLSGATPPEGLAQMRAPYVPICHHPLASETGLAPDRAAELKRIEAENLARAAHVLVPSPHTAEVLVADYGVAPARLSVANPGVARPEGGAAEKASPPEILAVGQLVPRKGHDILLRALAEIADLPWRATILGGATDAACAAELSDLRVGLGLEARVTFGGLVPPEQLAARYGQASVFALATRYEGYGMVFAEALVHGLPIVTCAAGAVPDTVPAEAGMIVPPDDVSAFAGALRQVLTDQAVHMSLTAGATQAGARLPTWADTAEIAAGILSRVAQAARA